MHDRYRLHRCILMGTHHQECVCLEDSTLPSSTATPERRLAARGNGRGNHGGGTREQQRRPHESARGTAHRLEGPGYDKDVRPGWAPVPSTLPMQGAASRRREYRLGRHHPGPRDTGDARRRRNRRDIGALRAAQLITSTRAVVSGAVSRPGVMHPAPALFLPPLATTTRRGRSSMVPFLMPMCLWSVGGRSVGG
jgi:hypothetical protein